MLLPFLCGGGIGKRFERHKSDTKKNTRNVGLIKADMQGANPYPHF